MKAVGKRLPWKDIEILNDENGKPYVHLQGKAKREVEGHLLVSITHTHTLAVAIAILLSSRETP